MKKILLMLLVALCSNSMVAQVLQTENFNNFTVGNVTTAFDGAVAGQGSYFLFSSNGAVPTTTTNAAITNAQIVSSGNSSLGVQLTGPDGDKGSRFMWKDGLPALWSARTSGNNIIELEVDINPGAGTTISRNSFGVYIYNAAGTRVLAGFFVRASTRELFLVTYSTPTNNPVGNYNYSLAAAPGIQLPANVFSRIGISFNKTSGAAIIKGPGIPAAGISVVGSAAGDDPGEVDFIAVSGHATATPNTMAFSMVMDNLTYRASNADTLLSINENSSVADISVYPNPSRDIVNIDSASNTTINGIEISDINGRVVKVIDKLNTQATQINISDLSAGMYMMNIMSDQGTTTKKIIKN